MAKIMVLVRFLPSCVGLQSFMNGQHPYYPFLNVAKYCCTMCIHTLSSIFTPPQRSSTFIPPLCCKMHHLPFLYPSLEVQIYILLIFSICISNKHFLVISQGLSFTKTSSAYYPITESESIVMSIQLIRKSDPSKCHMQILDFVVTKRLFIY